MNPRKVWIMDKQTAELLEEYEKGKIKTVINSSNPYPVKNVAKTDPYLGVTGLIFNGPATIVMWSDGTKTVVKCHEEEFDKEKGLAMAICKKVMGNKGNYYNVMKKLLKAVEGDKND